MGSKKEVSKNASENASASVDKEKDLSDSFRSPLGLEKALIKVNKNLPKSPSKLPSDCQSSASNVPNKMQINS